MPAAMQERRAPGTVSVLFSEPKIPQYCDALRVALVLARFQCSSASRKFLNSILVLLDIVCNRMFQCSSASRKFLNTASTCYGWVVGVRFSALQRAENSSMGYLDLVPDQDRTSFSALQRAENSSIDTRIDAFTGSSSVSVLFSEPKIPQYYAVEYRGEPVGVSVLFSEPKIPQLTSSARMRRKVLVSVLFSEPKIPQYRQR